MTYRLEIDTMLHDSEKSFYELNSPFVADDSSMISRLVRRMVYMGHDGNTFIKNLLGKIKCHEPEIELCDIIDFIYELKKKRPIMHSCVYIDICKDDKYYVGFSSKEYLDESIEPTDRNMAINRLNSHRGLCKSHIPSTFTFVYPVISNLISFYGDKEDEDLITILMSKYVGNHVRGGRWANVFSKPKYPEYTLDELKEKLLSRSFEKKLKKNILLKK